MAWSAAFCLTVLLLTVRAYASSGNGMHTDLSIRLPPACVGKELCLTKPDDYPTEEIDRFARRLQKRWKRHSAEHWPPIAVARLKDANNCATLYTTVQPFAVTHNNTSHYVIQSSFFTQTFQIAWCEKESARCFQDFLLPQVKTNCRTKFTAFYLTIYDSNNSRAKQVESLFPVDCACELDLISKD